MVTATVRHDMKLSNLSLFPMFFSQDRRSVLPRVICKYICICDFKFLPWQLTEIVSGHSACWWNGNSKYVHVYRQSQGWINSGSGDKWAACSSKGWAITIKFKKYDSLWNTCIVYSLHTKQSNFFNIVLIWPEFKLSKCIFILKKSLSNLLCVMQFHYIVLIIMCYGDLFYRSVL